MNISLIEVERSLRLLYADSGVTITSREYLVLWLYLVAYRFFLRQVGEPCGERFQPQLQEKFRNEIHEEAHTVGLCAPMFPNFDAQLLVHLIFDQSLLYVELTEYGRSILLQLPSEDPEEKTPRQLEDYAEALFK